MQEAEHELNSAHAANRAAEDASLALEEKLPHAQQAAAETEELRSRLSEAGAQITDLVREKEADRALLNVRLAALQRQKKAHKSHLDEKNLALKEMEVRLVDSASVVEALRARLLFLETQVDAKDLLVQQMEARLVDSTGTAGEDETRMASPSAQVETMPVRVAGLQGDLSVREAELAATEETLAEAEVGWDAAKEVAKEVTACIASL
jgi:chromosome segregation ATPase